MSEASNNSTKKEVRLYRRGNDDIDLDAWLSNVSSGWLSFKDNLVGRSYVNSKGKRIELKDEDLSKISAAYDAMFQGLNSGNNSISYAYDKSTQGFNNVTGVTDANKDYYGIVANYFGDALRGMGVYNKPKETPVIAPVAYSDSALGTIFKDRLLGKYGTIRSFIDKDTLEGGKRGNTERSRLSRDVINQMLKDLSLGLGEFAEWSDEQKKYATPTLNSLLEVFNTDNAVANNEYLDLEKYLGISDIRKWYATDTDTLPTRIDADGNIDEQDKAYYDSLRTILERYVPYTGDLMSFTLDYPTEWETTTDLNTRNALNAINTKLSRATPLELTTLIKGLMNASDYRTLDWIKQLNLPANSLLNTAENLPKARNLLLQATLNYLKRTPATDTYGLNYFGQTDPNSWYIIGTDTPKNTGFVYNRGLDGAPATISEMSFYNIPYWLSKMAEYGASRSYTSDINPIVLRAFPRKKNGGTIRKFDIGGKTGILAFNPNRNNRYFKGDFSTYNNWHAKNIVLPWLNSIASQSSSYEFETKIKEALDKWNDAGGFDWLGATDELRKHGMLSAGTQALLEYIRTNFPELNAQIGAHLSEYNIPVNGEETDNFVNGNFEGTNTDFGILTGNRRPTIHVNTTGLELTDWDNYFKNLGYVGRYNYLNHWVPTKNKDLEGIVLFSTPSGTDPTKTGELESVPSTTAITTPSTNIKINNPVPSGTHVGETGTKNKKKQSGNGGGFMNTTSRWLPTILDVANRLPLAFRYNRKIEDALQRHLALNAPINIDRRVLGNDAVKQGWHRYGSLAYSVADKQADSDADRNAARMRDAYRTKIESDIKGNMADNEAIRDSLERKRDLKERLLFYNDLFIYRPNKRAIADYWNTVGLIRASRLLKDWRSTDAGIALLTGKMLEIYDEDRDYMLAALESLSARANRSVYLDELDQILNLISAYEAKYPTKDITLAPWFTSVRQRKVELADRLANDNVLSSGKIRGYSYTDLYKDDPYEQKDWKSIII